MQIASCKFSIAGVTICNLRFAICNLQFIISARQAVAALWLVVGVSSGLSVHADVLELTNGGRVEGRLIQPAEGDKKSYVVELAGGGRVAIPRANVARVDATFGAEAEYAELARTAADTVESHWKLAEWCRERKLRELAQRHLTRILELEPDHEQARAILGFRKKDGQWMTRDEVMAARGMVMYEGRYVTRQHVELLERQEEAKVTHADWANRLELLRRWLTGRRQDRSAQAQAEIQSIEDPAAAEAVVAMLKREDDPGVKRLWMEVASRMDHRAAIDMLVKLSLLDADPEIRHQSLEYLIQSGRRGLATPYIRALKDRDNEIVNRAGAALSQIGEPSAAGALIDALITKHQFKVADGNPGQQTYTLSSQSGGMTFGGGGPKYRVVPLRNPDVLAALVSLSGGVSFDYDQQQWRRWLAAQAKQQAVDIRRDL
jgi:hypothetical protein